MLNVSQDFHKVFQSGLREIFIKIYVNGKLYQKEDINKFECDMGSLSGDTFSVGSTFSNSIKIEFCSIVEGLKELDKVDIEMGIKTYSADNPLALKYPARVGQAKVGKAQLISYRSDEYEFCKLGTFYIKGRVDPDRNENVTSIEAMDSFIYMGGSYKSELNYPAKIKDVAIEIANLSGIEVKMETFNSLSNRTINEPVGYTFRQAIGLIAQFQAGFATFDREGLLDIRTLTDSKYKVTPNEYYQKGLVKNEMTYRVGGISCKIVEENETTMLYAGSKNGAQITLENNVMTQSLLDEIYRNIKKIEYYPYSLKWRGNPALEIGEWITLTDRKGNTFKTPNLSYKLTFAGGLTAQSSADTSITANATYAYKGPIQQKLEEMDNRIDAAGKNTIYDDLDEPKYPKEGDLWFKPNGPDTEIWVYTKTGDNQYEWVKKTSTALDDDIKEQIENATPSDEIVKTINLSTEMDGKEWLKIEGAKLWLTNETKIDRAIITSAMIASVDAGTINVGTLNGGTVNVINLNARALTAGVISGTNLSINLDTGEVSFRKGIIQNDSGTLKIDVTNGNVKVIGGQQSITLNSSGMSIDASDSTHVGYMGVGYGNSSKDDNGMLFGLELNKAFTIGRRTTGKGGYPSIIGIHYNQDLIDINFPITKIMYGKPGYSTYINGNNLLNHDAEYGHLFNHNVSGGLNGVLMLTKGQITSWANWNFSNWTLDKVRIIASTLSVTGAKNAIHVTRSGVRATPAYELAESYLGDIGVAKTDDDGQVRIEIEELFNDTVNTIDYEYQVFLQSYDEGLIWVSQRNETYFVVQSNQKNIEFAWEIKAKRRGYETERLVLQEEFDNKKIIESFCDEKEHENYG